MKNIIGIRYKKAGKIYFFDNNDIDVVIGDNVIVETEDGYDYGEVVVPKRIIETKSDKDLRGKVVRKATKMDTEHFMQNNEIN